MSKESDIKLIAYRDLVGPGFHDTRFALLEADEDGLPCGTVYDDPYEIGTLVALEFKRYFYVGESRERWQATPSNSSFNGGYGGRIEATLFLEESLHFSKEAKEAGLRYFFGCEKPITFHLSIKPWRDSQTSSQCEVSGFPEKSGSCPLHIDMRIPLTDFDRLNKAIDSDLVESIKVHLHTKCCYGRNRILIKEWHPDDLNLAPKIYSWSGELLDEEYPAIGGEIEDWALSWQLRTARVNTEWTFEPENERPHDITYTVPSDPPLEKIEKQLELTRAELLDTQLEIAAANIKLARQIKFVVWIVAAGIFLNLIL